MTSVRLETTMGTIEIQLNEEKAPISSKNFLEYVDAGHYDGTIFHRVIDGFMIQGGGFANDPKRGMVQKPTNATIKNEWQNGLKNVRGALAMARLGGNPDSASCQFFINVVDNSFLDKPQPDGAAYAAFAMVTKGMDVVDKIRTVQTTSRGGHSDVPKEPVVILQAKRI